MNPSENDNIPMLSAVFVHSDDRNDSRRRGFPTRTMSLPMSIIHVDSFEHENNLVGATRPLRNVRRSSSVQMSTGSLYIGQNREITFQPPQSALLQQTTEIAEIELCFLVDGMNNNDSQSDNNIGESEDLLESGQLGMCNNYKVKAQNHSRKSDMFNAMFHNIWYGDAKGWGSRTCSFFTSYTPGVTNPHIKSVQRWTKFFLITCLFAIFLDQLLGFMLFVNKENKCIMLNWPMTTSILILRSMTDFVYFLNILLQFRLAYSAREKRSFGGEDLVRDPGRITRNYVNGYFMLDLFAVLPLPQIIILETAKSARIQLLVVAVIVQCVLKLHRITKHPSAGFILRSSAPWARLYLCLGIYVLCANLVGFCWYIFGIQRVTRCLLHACDKSNITYAKCMQFIDCRHGNNIEVSERDLSWSHWKFNDNATACFGEDGGYDFGIYKNAVNLTTHESLVTRYMYSLFWAFQQFSTLAGNQVPGYNLFEVLFIMLIMLMGLTFLSFTIATAQNFLLCLNRRSLEVSLRLHDFGKWMRDHGLPEELGRKVKEAEDFNLLVTRGINEDMLLENLPEDLQKDIRRHLFKYLEKVQIFKFLDEPIVDAICERLRTKTFMEGRKIMDHGGLVNKMIFIVWGKMESTGEDQNVVQLLKGDVCGEELLTWCLQNFSVNQDGRRIRISQHKCLSKRSVRCSTNVQAFVLRAVDLEEVSNLFARLSQSPRVQRAVRYESSHVQILPARRRIRVAWRCKKKRQLSRTDS